MNPEPPGLPVVHLILFSKAAAIINPILLREQEKETKIKPTM